MATPSKTPVIVVLGGINMDLVSVSSRIPQAGETILGDSFFTAPGGKGANQAVAAARLGASVRMVGRIGNDAFGRSLLDGMRSEGIDVSRIAEDEGVSSGIAMILLESGGANRIIVVPGANALCGDEQYQAVVEALRGADALMLQNEVDTALSTAAARYAQSAGVKVIWDPAPAVDLPQDTLATADVWTPNQVEAEMLTGIAVDSQASAAEAARILLRIGARAAVVKLGELGACFATPTEEGFVPAFAVDAVDTTAAGDAFAAGLAVGLSEGMLLSDAVRFASAAGALAVTKRGAQPAMPLRQEVDALLRRPS
jgi:ribokinase